MAERLLVIKRRCNQGNLAAMNIEPAAWESDQMSFESTKLAVELGSH